MKPIETFNQAFLNPHLSCTRKTYSRTYHMTPKHPESRASRNTALTVYQYVQIPDLRTNYRNKHPQLPPLPLDPTPTSRRNSQPTWNNDVSSLPMRLYACMIQWQSNLAIAKHLRTSPTYLGDESYVAQPPEEAYTSQKKKMEANKRTQI